ncbi:Gfo/Idh/MocA family protein [Clostridium tagluense]|uniref:Gfo/Idh/MocA family protein n=1 Tax=Clostridium tagluense TaxID=360422 RepID=UPI001C6ED835|nr:Gfo/Idh/MocA family oxidoreductase [Clostridium tagluense]MBW9155994.1 Gfo/Idh/MocA family oxidoreductase [Clostridium tagluense]WLC64042.1 Gfo/Idh/MocA family oxidoreductase [Clostridium tagluense]
MNKEVIRFGVIGTNNITDWFLNGAAQVKDFILTAVYSRSEEKGKAFAEKYNVEHIFTDLFEMAKSDLIDAVYIASPNAIHAEQAIVFLNHKKHVLCEKALASNASQVISMMNAAKINQVILMEAMKTTQLPNFKIIKDNLHRIGKVRKYFGSYCQYSSRYDKYREGIVLNAFNQNLSNGGLMDIGVYCIHPMINLFGKPKEIKANALILESGVDGEGSIIFKYDEMDAIAMYSKITNSKLHSEIQGEDGNIIIENINKFEKVKIVFRDGKEEDLTQFHNEHDMCYEIETFITMIKNGDIKGSSKLLQTSKWVMETMDEARKQIGLVFPADLQ